MKKANTGFTLIELMITVAIVGILAAIAYPTYLDKVRASRRTDAKTALLKAANREEQYYTTQHEYTDDLDKLGVDSVTDNKAYTLSASVSGTDNQKFTITATAQNDQANDKCTPLSINQTGQKKVNGSTADIGCW